MRHFLLLATSCAFLFVVIPRTVSAVCSHRRRSELEYGCASRERTRSRSSTIGGPCVADRIGLASEARRVAVRDVEITRTEVVSEIRGFANGKPTGPDNLQGALFRVAASLVADFGDNYAARRAAARVVKTLCDLMNRPTPALVLTGPVARYTPRRVTRSIPPARPSSPNNNPLSKPWKPWPHALAIKIELERGPMCATRPPPLATPDTVLHCPRCGKTLAKHCGAAN